MARKTIKELSSMVGELLELKSGYERYRQLESEVKVWMLALKRKEVVVDEAGMVKLSQYDRVTVTAELAEEVLGDKAQEVIIIKRTVPNDLIKAFVKAGRIGDEAREQLMSRADRSPVVRLYVRRV